MNKGTSRGLKSKLCKMVALTLALVMALGVLPVSAAVTKKIVVTTKKQLLKALEKKSSATIVFKTNKNTKFVIPEIANSANKKLVIKAPNAKVYNKASFKTISLKSSGYFNERGKDNSIYIKSDGAKLTVSKEIETKKISVTADDVLIKVASKAEVGELICNKKDASITVNVAKDADANITLKKKTDLTVAGDKTAEIKVVAQAKDSKITASAPVDVVAKKNLDVVLEKGSEGSSVDSSKGVDVDLSGDAKKAVTVTEDGKTVQEPETKEEEKKEEEKKDTTASTDTTTTTPDPGQTQVTPSTPVTVDDGKVTIRFAPASGGAFYVTMGTETLSSGAKVEKGSLICISASPQNGKQVDTVTITDGAGELIDYGNKVWSVSDIVKDLTITVTFKDFVETQKTPKNVLKVSAIQSTTVEVENGHILATGGAVSAKVFNLVDPNNQNKIIRTVWVASGGAFFRFDNGENVTSELVRTYDGVDFSGVGDNDHDIITQGVLEKIKGELINVECVYIPENYQSQLIISGVTVRKKPNGAPRA